MLDDRDHAGIADRLLAMIEAKRESAKWRVFVKPCK